MYSDSSFKEVDLPSFAVLKCESSIQKEVITDWLRLNVNQSSHVKS